MVDLLNASYFKFSADLRNKHLLYLNQLVSSDGIALLHWDDINTRYPAKQKYNRQKRLAWFDILSNQVTISSHTNRLQSQYTLTASKIPDPPIETIDSSPRHREWLATWSPQHAIIMFGRSFTKFSNNTVKAEHWITYHPNTQLTPMSSPPLLLPCSGCILNEGSHKKYRCTFIAPLSTCFLLPLAGNKTVQSRHYTEGFPIATSLYELKARALKHYNNITNNHTINPSSQVTSPSNPATSRALQASYPELQQITNAKQFLTDFCSDISDTVIHVFTDGSLKKTSLTTELGCGWILTNQYFSFSFYTFFCSTSLWPFPLKQNW